MILDIKQKDGKVKYFLFYSGYRFLTFYELFSSLFKKTYNKDSFEIIDKDITKAIKKKIDLPLLLKNKHDEEYTKVIYEPTVYSYDYTYDIPLVLSEGYDSSNCKSNYVYLNNRLIEDTKSNKSYLYDGKYSISEVKTNNSLLSLRYDIYGNILTPLTQEDKTFSYNTQEFTPQNRLYYIKARYYDPTTCSFITKDTYLGNIYKPNTTNRYAYCSGDPVNYKDLDGHKAVTVNNIYGGGPLKPISRPLSGGNSKPSNTPSGAYTSGGFDGGSSYIYVPPPPNPREKYQKPSFFDKLKAKVSSTIDTVKSFISNTKKTIKSVVSTISNSRVVKNDAGLLSEVTIKLSKSTVEIAGNNIPNNTLDSFGNTYITVDVAIGGSKLSSLTPSQQVVFFQELYNSTQSDTSKAIASLQSDELISKTGTSYKTISLSNNSNIIKQDNPNYEIIQSSLYDIQYWNYRPTQCVHFSGIYTYDHYGINISGYGNEKDIANGLITRNRDVFEELRLNSNSTQEEINQIKPGSVFSTLATSTNPNGHTGIIEKIVTDESGNIANIITSEANVDENGGF